MQFKVIPPGTFTRNNGADEITGGMSVEMMEGLLDSGDPLGADGYKLTLTQSFELGVHEVTNNQFRQVMGYSAKSRFNHGDHNSVDQVSHGQAVVFCKTLSDLPEEQLSGYAFRRRQSGSTPAARERKPN